MQKKIGIGVIGFGVRIRTVLDELLKADVDGQIEIVAAYDPDPLSIESARKSFPHHAIKEAVSYQELSGLPEVDWVFIGSWNCSHAEHTVCALEAGKHVFCEKPLATTLEGCMAIKEAVDKSQATFAFGLVLRYMELYQKIKELIHSGTIGRIVSFEFNETLRFEHGGYIHGNWRRLRKNAGTHLLEKCCHDYDITNWLTNSIPIKAASFGGNNFFTSQNKEQLERVGKNSHGKYAFQTWDDPHCVNPFTCEKDIVDNQVAILEYANGVRASFHTNCCAGIPERRIYICGTEGTIRADWDILEYKRIGLDEEVHQIRIDVAGGHGGGDRRMANALMGCIMGKEKPLAGVKEGLLSAIACYGVDEALDTGKVVDVSKMWARAGIDVTEYTLGS